MGTQRPPPKKIKDTAPNFRPCLLWPNGCMYQDTTWYGGRPQAMRHCVRWGPSFPSPKPQFSVNVRCGQTAGWTKIPLGIEVCLGPGDFVFDGEPAPPQKKGTSPPNFGPCTLWPNGSMDEDATWYGSRPWPRPHCVRWGSSSPRKGHSTSPSFRPMSIVARSPMSATAELLLYLHQNH